MVTLFARPLPHHVGIILDGNGRWAELRGLPRTEGHRRGSDSVREIVRAARRLGLGVLTLYSFSAQNWRRPSEEVHALMELLAHYLDSEREEILSNGIRLVAIGQRARLPEGVQATLRALEHDSRNNTAMTLALGLSYGGREEILEAVGRLWTTTPRETALGVDLEKAFLDNLESARLGEPDLIIRTGGELRLSNFLLWGSAYAELHFTDCLWPDFRAADLYAAIADYQSRQRRFGGLPPQPKGLPCPT